MKIINIFLFLILSINLFPQVLSEVNQLTYVDGDARNIFLPIFNYAKQIFFEVHKDNYSNIYSMVYNWENQEFDNLKAITNDSSMNINAALMGNILSFQTNKNGNWDIAYKIFSDSVWSETKYAANSSLDETQPALFSLYAFSSDDSIRIMYQMNNSIYLSTFRDSIFNSQLIFEGNDSVKYTQPTGVNLQRFFGSPETGRYIAAKKISGKENKLIYKYKNESNEWEEEKTIIENNDFDNARFMSYDWGVIDLIYESKDSNYKNIFFMNDWVNTKYANRFIDTLIGDLSDLRTSVIMIITKKNPLPKVEEQLLFTPHTFKYLINDSSFISISKYEDIGYNFGNTDTLIYTKVKNSSLALGAIDHGYTYYTIWEDSIDGHIQLFGTKSYNNFGDVNDPEIPAEFTLYQNYPNPFNPSTTIQFYNPHDSYIKLKVFNVLGEEVKKLADGFFKNGMNEINFHASDLPSGIYFYQLEGENFKQVKKMILLR